MLGACRLNNRSIRVCRRDATYQAVIIDLALLGAISKEDCELLIGSGIPAGLTLPNGDSFIYSEADDPDEPDSDDSDETNEPDPDETNEPDSDDKE